MDLDDLEVRVLKYRDGLINNDSLEYKVQKTSEVYQTLGLYDNARVDRLNQLLDAAPDSFSPEGLASATDTGLFVKAGELWFLDLHCGTPKDKTYRKVEFKFRTYKFNKLKNGGMYHEIVEQEGKDLTMTTEVIDEIEYKGHGASSWAFNDKKSISLKGYDFYGLNTKHYVLNAPGGNISMNAADFTYCEEVVGRYVSTALGVWSPIQPVLVYFSDTQEEIKYGLYYLIVKPTHIFENKPDAHGVINGWNTEDAKALGWQCPENFYWYFLNKEDFDDDVANRGFIIHNEICKSFWEFSKVSIQPLTDYYDLHSMVNWGVMKIVTGCIDMSSGKSTWMGMLNRREAKTEDDRKFKKLTWPGPWDCTPGFGRTWRAAAPDNQTFQRTGLQRLDTFYHPGGPELVNALMLKYVFGTNPPPNSVMKEYLFERFNVAYNAAHKGFDLMKLWMNQVNIGDLMKLDAKRYGNNYAYDQTWVIKYFHDWLTYQRMWLMSDWNDSRHNSEPSGNNKDFIKALQPVLSTAIQ
jgi:hypothetical protein